MIKRLVYRLLLYSYFAQLRIWDFNTNCVSAVLTLIVTLLLILTDVVLFIRIFYPFRIDTDCPLYLLIIGSLFAVTALFLFIAYLKAGKAQRLMIRAFDETESLTVSELIAAFAITYLPMALGIILLSSQPVVN